MLLRSFVAACLLAFVAAGCMDESGNAVDWFFMYKIPYNSKSTNPHENGFGYAYFDAHSTSLKISTHSIEESTGAMHHTLTQIYKASSSDAYVMYNDEPDPDSGIHDSSTRAHAKGVVFSNSNSGFWLVHSVPRWPPIKSAGDYSFTGDEKIYAQTFLCMSYSASSLEKVAQILMIDWPQVYDSNLPSSVASKIPSLENVISGTKNKDVTNDVVDLTTSGGNKFKVFGKSKEWAKELYEDLIAPTLKSNVQAETWIRSPALPSFCKPQYEYDVENVQSINIGDGITWPETKDHAKWAIATQSTYICVGGINRMSSQAGRGGGAVCLSQSSFYKAMQGTIGDVATCDDASTDRLPIEIDLPFFYSSASSLCASAAAVAFAAVVALLF